ncbi:rod shape-determining protein MreC [Melghiribacillus thermohalophilus]|uniref:Cell shape-determining protein MreC n=1 Tax=Melghiribacillus thermohalophilus TaxID=1324956 RepID=A0A4R3NDW6_9BACI|nr:rod shape-determining protein MreC [Melghiribacillus thermohalophilus]TCT27130.1 rod shape-determining protein MreC [Melghiribacillus thermohalophilus]
MTSFFKRRKLILILISMVFLVALIGFSIRERENKTLPEQLILDTAGWIQSIFHAPVSMIENFFNHLHDLKNTYEQNELLKSRLSEYKNLLYEVQALEKENEELRAIIDKEKSLRDYRTIHAEVIARTREAWFRQVTINKGSQHGIQANMAVITADGMIGKIQSTTPFTSRVQLLSGFDRNNKISAVISDQENVFGLIEGYDEEKKMLLFQSILEESEITEGQLVVSSGMGGVFPSGLVIGTVESVETDSFGLTRIAYVKPAADLSNLNHVMVIDREEFSPALDEEEMEEES